MNISFSHCRFGLARCKIAAVLTITRNETRNEAGEGPRTEDTEGTEEDTEGRGIF